MPEITETCPYCRGQNRAGANRCDLCGAIYPWASDVRELRRLVKESEANRTRTIVDVIERLFSAATPRIVIVIGSLLGTLLLAAQTFILWNQTTLLSRQTLAVQLDQATKLREEISSMDTQSEKVRQLAKAYAGSLGTSICKAENCTNSLVVPVLQNLNQDPPRLPSKEVALAWITLSKRLASIETATAAVLPPQGLDLAHPAEALQGVQAIVEPATVQCLYDPAASRVLIDDTSALAQLTFNAFWVRQPLADPQQYLRIARQFPQTLSNTQLGIDELQDAMIRAHSIIASETGPDERAIRKSLRLAEVLPDAIALQTRVTSGLTKLASRCEHLSAHDVQSLIALTNTSD